MNKKDDICQKCKIRKATANWTGEGGVMAYIHGMYERRCRRCCVEEQLEYARKIVAGVPALKKELAGLLAAEKK